MKAKAVLQGARLVDHDESNQATLHDHNQPAQSLHPRSGHRQMEVDQWSPRLHQPLANRCQRALFSPQRLSTPDTLHAEWRGMLFLHQACSLSAPTL